MGRKARDPEVVAYETCVSVLAKAADAQATAGRVLGSLQRDAGVDATARVLRALKDRFGVTIQPDADPPATAPKPRRRRKAELDPAKPVLASETVTVLRRHADPEVQE